MESLERVLTALLDEKLATLDMKKELGEKLGINPSLIEYVDLVVDDLCVNQCIVVAIGGAAKLSKVNLLNIPFDYITMDFDGNLLLVFKDE